MEVAAGAGALGTEAKARQKTGEDPLGYKISNNFGDRRYPKRGGSGDRKSGTTAQATAPVGAGKKADLIPSDDEEVQDAGTTPPTTPVALRQGRPVGEGGTEGAMESAPKPAAGKRRQENDAGGDQGGDEGTPQKPAATSMGARKKRAKGLGASHRKEAAGYHGDSSIGSGSDNDDSMDDASDGDLRFGMAELYQRMKMPGTTATRLAAAAAQTYSSEENWVDEFGGLVAGLHTEHTALATALAPENASQTYLAILGGSGNFAVLHGLQRWPAATCSSINDGRLIAFEGKTTKENQPPDVWRFDDGDESLFRLQGFAEVEPSRVAKFYSTPDRVDENFFDEVCPDDTGLWIGSLIPVPIMWAALFLDYPNMGTAFRRMEDLVRSVEKSKRHIFRPLVMSMAYACHQRAGSEDSTNALAMPWKRIPRSKPALQVMTRMWGGGADSRGNDDRSERAAGSTADDFDNMFGGGQRRPVYVPPVRPDQTARPKGGLMFGASQPPVAGASTAGGMQGSAAGGMQGTDFATIMATILQSQTDNQLAIAAASNANMIAFQTATAQALATKSGDKDSKLTAIKRKILQACAGHTDTATFSSTAVYQEMETEGSATDALGRILRRLLKPVVRSIHKSNIYVTPQLVQMVKSLSFSANGDKTHAGCTKGITIFAVPWRTVEAMNEMPPRRSILWHRRSNQWPTSGNMSRVPR